MKTASFRKLLVLGLVIVLVGMLMPQAVQAETPGADPNFPIHMTLEPNEVGFHTGMLAAGQEVWFAINVAELEGDEQLPLQLSAYTFPGDGNVINNMAMEVFNSSYAAYWSNLDLDNDEAMYFGRGFPVKHEDGDPFVGSVGWSGDVTNNESVLVCLRNNNAFPVSYWFFTDDMINADFGPAETPAPIEVAAGTDPNNPVWLEMGPKDVSTHNGQLMPDEEAWFAVNVAELEGDEQLPLQLSLYTFPGDGNVINNMAMEIFNSSYAAYWSNMDVDNDEAMYFGRGFPVEHEEGDPMVGSIGWSGEVTNNEAVLVCLRNDNAFPVSFWFFTDDVIDAELGPLAEPIAAETPEQAPAVQVVAETEEEVEFIDAEYADWFSGAHLSGGGGSIY